MFTPGHKLATGRPKGSKNLLPIIRDKALQKLYKRMKELDTVDIEELLSFAKTIMPKDVSVRVDTQVQYISNTPRPVIDVSSNSSTSDRQSIGQSIDTVSYVNKVTDTNHNVNDTNQSIINDTNQCNSNSNNNNTVTDIVLETLEEPEE